MVYPGNRVLSRARENYRRRKSMSDAAMTAFAQWLSERCEFLRNLEREAERVLQEDKDTEKYKALMCQKAMFLQALPVEAEKHASAVPVAMARPFMQRLERFSENAGRALSLDSIFYMYALLYPDDHVEGGLNDLERLAAEAHAQAGR